MFFFGSHFDFNLRKTLKLADIFFKRFINLFFLLDVYFAEKATKCRKIFMQFDFCLQIIQYNHVKLTQNVFCSLDILHKLLIINRIIQ